MLAAENMAKNQRAGGNHQGLGEIAARHGFVHGIVKKTHHSLLEKASSRCGFPGGASM